MKKILSLFIILTILILSLSFGLAKFSQFRIKIPKKIPLLDKVLKREPVIITDLSNAVTQISFLDDYEPQIAAPLGSLPRTPEGAFIIEKPGNYMFPAQSYCLGPGKAYPSGEYGYVYAPLKGKYADIIKNLLRRSYKYPEIPQEDIQVLIWGIISRAKISEMPRDIQLVASKLLTPEEIFKINGGALGLIPEEILEKALEKLPPGVQEVIRAEARIREMLSEGYSTYEEIESVAVRMEIVPPPEGNRDIPQGRWSLHPEGFFIRYFPYGYSKTLIEVYIPRPYKIEYDQKGRIVSIKGPLKCKIETIYDDSIEPVSVPEEPSLKAYAFKKIIFEGFSFGKDKIVHKEWDNTGWTFARNTEQGRGTNNFKNIENRYELYKKQKKELIDLNNGLVKLGKALSKELGEEKTNEILTIGSYVRALKEVISSSDENWVIDPVSFTKEAWMTSVSKNLIGHKEKYIFDPVEDPTSGNAGEQPLAESGRGTEDDDDCMGTLDNCLDRIGEDRSNDIDDCMEERQDKDWGGECDWSSINLCFPIYASLDGWEETVNCFHDYCEFEGNEDDILDLKKCFWEAYKRWWDRMNTECYKEYKDCLEGK